MCDGYRQGVVRYIPLLLFTFEFTHFSFVVLSRLLLQRLRKWRDRERIQPANAGASNVPVLNP